MSGACNTDYVPVWNDINVYNVDSAEISNCNGISPHSFTNVSMGI